MNDLQSSQSPLLIEVAWEVCSQIGGIYTVIKTKAPTMTARWGTNYVLVGPYHQHTSSLEFEAAPPPEHIAPVLTLANEKGLQCKFGYWLSDGRPQVILIDYTARNAELANDKYYLWKDNGVSIDGADGEVDAVTAFGFCVADLFQCFAEHSPQKIIGHFHEWMAGVAVPRIRHLNLPVGTIFTTHATQLGRYIAGNDPNFYDNLPNLSADSEARRYMIWSKHAIEKAAAHSAHIFTTVSEVTAKEAHHVLDRKPDMVLPNGLNPHSFTALHEFQNLHLQYKERIHEFVMGHFFPSYSFDLDNTLYFFTSGRYEYKNKGMDIFIESLYQLNQRLRSIPNAPTIIAFIVTRAPTKSLNVTSLQNHLRFEDLKTATREMERLLGQKVLNAVARGHLPTYEDILSEDIQLRLKRSILARRTEQWPPVVTHDLWDDNNDAILNHLRHRNLLNSPDDKVKVIFHPDFLSLTSLLSLDYDQFVRGCHLGVFPSYYEPWGYTPLECLALGLPTVTTNLSGFGAYVERHVPDALQNGVLVLNRAQESAERSIEQLTTFLTRFTSFDRRERIALRNRAERLTERFTWDILCSHYNRAHTEVIERVTTNVTKSSNNLFSDSATPLNGDLLSTRTIRAQQSS